MLNSVINFWTRTPIAWRTDHFILVWFGVIVGGVVAMAVPVILIFSHEIADQRYVAFFYAFFTWWPVFALLGSILLFHDFWFNMGSMLWKRLSGEKSSWRRPGAVFYGGFLGSLLLVILLGARYDLSTWYALDFIFMLIPFFHGFSRLACLNFGCCYGKKCSPSALLRVQYQHPDSEPVRHGIPAGQALHPVQLYEMACCVSIGCLMLFLAGRLGEGKIFASYLICYGIARFLLEFVRDNTHEKVLYNSISIWQLLSLVFVISGLILFLVLPEARPVLLRNLPTKINYTRIIWITIWNASAIGLVFGIHFRKRKEAL